MSTQSGSVLVPAELAAAWNWVLRLREDDASQEVLAEWLQWYEADERHKQAFEEMQAFWRESGRIVEGPRAISVEELLNARATGDSDMRHPLQARRRWAWLVAPVAAAVCAIAIGLHWLGANQHVIEADAGQRVVREAILPDGSSVELAARSAIEVQYTENERLLEMMRGEAHFSVAHNVERPFIVKVGELRVRAVGTAFNVRRTEERTVVTVTEGIVDVYSAHHSDGAGVEMIRATAGQQVIWDGKNALPIVAAVDVEQALAWKQGRLQYLNEPLAAVIEDVNRYASRPVEIRDPGVGEILFSGTVFTEATDVWLDALPAVFPIEVERSGEGRALRARPEGDSG